MNQKDDLVSQLQSSALSGIDPDAALRAEINAMGSDDLRQALLSQGLSEEQIANVLGGRTSGMDGASIPYDFSSPEQDAALQAQAAAMPGAVAGANQGWLAKAGNSLGSALKQTGTTPAKKTYVKNPDGSVSVVDEPGSGGTSGVQGALAAAKAAGLLYQALAGKNKQLVKKRDSTITDNGPTQNATANRKTLYATGGEIEGLPQDVKGGLLPLALQLAHHMAKQGGGKGFIHGEAGGQDDVVDVKAAPGEYVMDAEVVSALGDGNSKAGAAKLDQMRHNIRQHKRTGGLSQIPPKAKSTEQYLKGK